MRSRVPLFAVLAATMVVGCSSGDDGTSADGGPFTIVTDIDFTTETGTFRVKKGSEELGCSSGTFVNHALGQEASGPGESSGAILQVLTCTDGERSGSFLISFELAFSRWNFRSGTGDFAGVKGKGKFSVRRSPGPELSGVETLAGTVRFLACMPLTIDASGDRLRRRRRRPLARLPARRRA